MLPAALSFIMESARLGSHVDGETFGWTDVRPHSYTGDIDQHGALSDYNHPSVIGPRLRSQNVLFQSEDTTNGNLADQSVGLGLTQAVFIGPIALRGHVHHWQFYRILRQIR